MKVVLANHVIVTQGGSSQNEEAGREMQWLLEAIVGISRLNIGGVKVIVI